MQHTAAPRMAELGHRLRIQASAESAEAWVRFHIERDSAAQQRAELVWSAQEREAAASERLNRAEKSMQMHIDNASELKRQNQQLADSLKRLAESLAAVPESPENPVVFTTAATSTITQGPPVALFPLG